MNRCVSGIKGKMRFGKTYWRFSFQLHLVTIVSLACCSIVYAIRTPRVRSRLCSTVNLSNALVRYRHNYKIMRINCASGFTLQGNNMIGCENGKWNAALPVCTKEGCKKLNDPDNGILISTQLTATIYCKENYKIVGGKITYCNGTDWDRPLGECQEISNSTQKFCDFESDDLCGWSHDEFHNFDWKRVMAANMFQQVRTGPQHDHTTFTANGGHYMLLESFDQLPNSFARLISPIYPWNVTQKSCCFRFYYFMYGATVGTLNIYVKPVSVDMDKMLQDTKYLKFSRNGNQKNIWLEGIFAIEEMQDDFQIIIEGSAGSNHLSDIAIDDVHLMEYSQCKPGYTPTSTSLADNTDYAVYDVQSCEGRCGEVTPSGYGIKNIEGKFYKLCDCHVECENLLTCCPNFQSICEYENSPDVLHTSTNMPAVKDPPEYNIRTLNISQVSLPIASTTEIFRNSLILDSPSPTKSTYEGTIEEMLTKEAHAKNYSINDIDSAMILEYSTTSTMLSANVFSEDTSLSTHINTVTEQVPTIENIIDTSSPGYANKCKEASSKAKTITWEINHSLDRRNTNTTWFIFTITGFMLSVLLLLGTLLKYLGSFQMIGLRCAHGSWNDEYSEKTTLTYRQNSVIILQNHD